MENCAIFVLIVKFVLITEGPQFQFLGKITEYCLLTESVHDGRHPTATLSARCALVTNRETTRHVTGYPCEDWPYCFGVSHSSKRSLCEGPRPHQRTTLNLA